MSEDLEKLKFENQKLTNYINNFGSPIDVVALIDENKTLIEQVSELRMENESLKRSETCGYCDFGKKHQEEISKLSHKLNLLKEYLKSGPMTLEDFEQLTRDLK